MSVNDNLKKNYGYFQWVGSSIAISKRIIIGVLKIKKDFLKVKNDGKLHRIPSGRKSHWQLGFFNGTASNFLHRKLDLAHHKEQYCHYLLVYSCTALQSLLYIDSIDCWVTSKIRGHKLSYNGEGDIEYYDCDVSELQNYENSTLLIDNSDPNSRQN